MHYIKLHIGDYQRDTAHLTRAEHGAYLQLLLYLYSHNGRLEFSRRHRLLRSRNGGEAAALDRVIEEFCVVEPDGYVVNSRANRELKDHADRKLTSSKASEKRWGNKDAGPESASPEQTVSNRHQNQNQNQNQKERAQAPSRRFAAPSLQEVEAYCTARKNNVSAQKFIDFYEAKGWKIGSAPMKNWQAAVRTWEQRERSSTSAVPSTPTEPPKRVCGICGDDSGTGVHSQRGWRCMKHMGD